MIKIYRIEDKLGNGYKESLDSDIRNWTDEGFIGQFFANENEYFTRRPMPENDGIAKDKIKKHHLFGFKSIKDLNNWFLPADLVMGTLIGGVISIYHANPSNVVFGSKQLMFDKRKARLFTKVPMSFFLPEADKKSLFDFKEMAKENVQYEIDMIDGLEFLLNEV